MGRITIGRHGNLSGVDLARVNTSGSLPGSINMGFIDGHAATVPMDDLWEQYWHLGYEPPPQRPR